MAKKQFTETYPKVYKDNENIFNIVKMAKQTFRIALGNELVVEKVFKTRTEAQNYIDQKKWGMLINVYCVVTRKLVEQIKNEDNEQTK